MPTHSTPLNSLSYLLRPRSIAVLGASPRPASIGNTTVLTHTYTVQPTPVVLPGAVTVAEGDAGTVIADVPVSLSGPSVLPVTVDWTTIDYTATSPNDFVASSGTVTFAPGETSASVPVCTLHELQSAKR